MLNKVDIRSEYFPDLNNVHHSVQTTELVALEPKKRQSDTAAVCHRLFLYREMKLF